MLKALSAPLVLLASGCTGGDNPKMVEAPPPPPPTDKEKAEPKGKPPGYGTSDRYQKSMERAATR
jgi:hypothetical protein